MLDAPSKVANTYQVLKSTQLGSLEKEVQLLKTLELPPLYQFPPERPDLEWSVASYAAQMLSLN